MSTEIPGTLAEIRAQRNALNMEEDAISYVRRLAQGRLDLVQHEERRRASGADAPVGSLADRLADVFGQQLTSFFNLTIPFDVLMLSYNIAGFENTEYEVINKVKFSSTASGYLVAQHYYDKLIDLYEHAMPLLCQTGEHWNYANDIVWKDLQAVDTWYYFNKRIGKQASGYSDNSERYVEYDA